MVHTRAQRRHPPSKLGLDGEPVAIEQTQTDDDWPALGPDAPTGAGCQLLHDAPAREAAAKSLAETAIDAA
jgi:hypothetical protein